VTSMPTSMYSGAPKIINPEPKISPTPIASQTTSKAVSPTLVERPVLDKIVNSQQLTQKKPKNNKLVIILAILFLLILGLGSYWYFAYGQTMLLTRQMVFKIEIPDQKYVSNIDFVMNVKTKSSDSSSADSDPLNMFLPGADDFKLAVNGTTHVVAKDFEGNAKVSVNSGFFNFDNALDYKQIGQDVYFKFNKEFLSDLFGDFGLDVSEFFNKDRWLTFNFDEIKKLAESQLDTTISADVYNQDKQIEQNKKMNDYLDQFKLYQIFNIVDTKEIKDTKDGKLKKFQLIAKPTKIDDLMIMMSIFNPVYLGNTELKTPQEIKDKISKDFASDKAGDPEQYTQVQDLIQKTDFYIWVNEKAKAFQGLSVIWDGDVIDMGNEKVVLTGHFNLLNEAEDGFVINKPEQTITVQQAYDNTMKKMTEKRLETMKQYEEQNSKDSDSDGLSDVMESFYGTNALKPDTDGDGFMDGEEVDNGYNPLGPGKLDLGAIRS
jgi:hypothetical protein